jgi:hypothetical protein
MGGKVALDGFSFQQRYAFVKLVESMWMPGFSAILIEGAEDVELRFEKQGQVERIAIQVKNHRVTTSEAKEIIAHFIQLDTDSPNTWKKFVIVCTEVDEQLKTIHYRLEDYRRLSSGKFYSEDDKILTNTQADLESRIRKAGLEPANFVLESVCFEPDQNSFADDEWVSARVITRLQAALPNINYDIAQIIYLKLADLVSKSARKAITRDQVEEIISQHAVHIDPFHSRTIPFQAPHLKDNYVPRPMETQQVIRLLTADEGGEKLRKVAIHGLPGSGKSTLAMAVAHTQEVKEHFPHGVLWATLGQEPNLVGFLSGWVQALVDYQFQSGQPQEIQSRLNGMLQDRAVLMVIDDVWDAEQSKQLVAGGARCAVLLTSRETLTAKAAGVPMDCQYEIPDMQEVQALQVLAGGEDCSLDETDLAVAREISQALGYLPLALELASAQVQGENPISWEQLREDLAQEIAFLESLDDPNLRDLSKADQRKNFSLVSSITLSLRRLARPDLEKYAWFGVLPDDTDILVGMAAVLWGVNERQARNDLVYFRNKALLSIGVADAKGQVSYRLHDTLHEMAKLLLTGSSQSGDEFGIPGLDLTLVEAQGKFLERYRLKLRDGRWSTLKDDGYIYAHLTWHLEKAEQFSQLKELFADDNWLQVRVACDGYRYDGYLADLERAWQDTYRSCQEQIENGQPMTRAVDCIHLGLVQTSINSLSSNYTPAIVARAVALNLPGWTTERAFSIALHISEAEKRFDMLSGLMNAEAGLAGPGVEKGVIELIVEQALQAALAIEDERSRADALSGLAQWLVGAQIEQALQAALAIKDEAHRA